MANEFGKEMETEKKFSQMVREQKSTIYIICYMFADNRTEVDDLVQEVLVLRGILYDVSDVEQHVGILQGRLREGEHRLLQLVVGLEHAGRVGEHNLHLGGVHDAHYPVARGLRLERGYGYAFAHELVHQRRLAHVGVAHYVYESCLVHSHCGCFWFAAVAAARLPGLLNQFANIAFLPQKSKLLGRING